MKRLILAFLAIFLCCHSSAWAIATVTTSGTTYVTTEPAIANWVSGWEATTGTTGVTGLDYVGSIGGASAVYLGDGWVLSAAHVSLALSSTFTLSGVGYSISNITYIDGVDLVMFKISVTLSIPSLTIATSSLLSVGSSVVMVGNGGAADSWGQNTVTQTDLSVSVNSYTTVDFLTKLGNGRGYNNTALVVTGDSGGADYYYNTSTGKWVLVGINEAVATDTSSNLYSCMVDLSEYSDEIASIMETTVVPEPSTWALVALGALAWTCKARLKRPQAKER